MRFARDGAAQLAVVCLMVTLFWAAHLGIASWRERPQERWTRWLGVFLPPRWKQRLWAFPVAAVAGAALVFVQGLFIDDFGSFLEPTSAGTIARAEDPDRIVGALFYPLVTSALCEELFFRGVVAKRSIHAFGYIKGNLLQTVVFLAPHVLLVHFFAETSRPALFASLFVTVTPLAWLSGMSMHRADGGSIFTPWLIHAGVNSGNMLAVWMYLD